MKSIQGLKGEVRVNITGVEPERVLNLCADGGAELFDTERENDFSLLVTVRSFDMASLRRAVHRCGCEMKIVASYGGRELLRKAKRRYVLFAGLTLCVLAAALSSLFVWDIRIEGNDKLSDAEVIRALNDCGLDYGSFWPSVSPDDVKNAIMLQEPDISWLSLNMSGSRVEVLIHERVEKPEIVSEAELYSITAKKSGVILNLSVLEGQPAVGVGDTVTEGEVLISGTVDSPTGETRTVHALGDVRARTWYELNAVCPVEKTVQGEKTGSRLRIALLIGKNRINFYRDSRNTDGICGKINTIGYLSANAFVLPVGMAIQRESRYEPVCVSADIGELSSRLRADLLERLRTEIGDGQIVSSHFTESVSGGLLTVTLRAECTENIGE